MITIQKLKNYKLHTALRQLLPNFVKIFLIDLKKKNIIIIYTLDNIFEKKYVEKREKTYQRRIEIG